jgi:hypothetical protein
VTRRERRTAALLELTTRLDELKGASTFGKLPFAERALESALRLVTVQVDDLNELEARVVQLEKERCNGSGGG